MNSKEIKAIKNTECLCWKCLKKYSKENIHVIHVSASGYGSQFDNLSTEVQLCDNCYDETNPEWWKFEEIPFMRDGGKLYKYDNEIYQFLKSLPIESQEFVWNTCAYGACANYTMESQNWIDFELGELSHEKCKEYGFTSPDEEKAYQERFTTCQYPINEHYKDDSEGCRCPLGAYGNIDQMADEFSVSEECYNCCHYKKRETPILNVSDDDWEDLMLYFHYHLNKDKLEQKFDKLHLI